MFILEISGNMILEKENKNNQYLCYSGYSYICICVYIYFMHACTCNLVRYYKEF